MKGYLLDTCTFLWAALESEKIPDHSKSLIENPDTLLFLSAVSVWEIEVKFRLGKLKFNDQPLRQFITMARKRLDVFDLSFSEGAALRHSDLAPIHKDPFDRMLICQAMEHDLTIITPDKNISSYDVNTRW